MKSYYVFRYRAPGGPKSAGNRGWKHPKQYWGPFETRRDAQRQIDMEIAEDLSDDLLGRITQSMRRKARDHYRIQQLTDSGFKKLWGVTVATRATTPSASIDVSDIMQRTRPTPKKKGFFAKLFGG